MNGASSSLSLSQATGGNNSLSSRQRRRLESAQRNGPKRGPSRGLKALRQRLKNPTTKPTATITKAMRRIVGPNAGSFIAECSKWVKHYCPLNSRNWSKMDSTAKQDLFDKIKGEWNLPTGGYVNTALKLQCAMLFRHWRYRLKEQYFTGKTRDEALANRPSDVDPNIWNWLVNDYWSDPKTQRISAANKANRLRQTIKTANGALSTARILHNMRHAPTPAVVQSEGGSEQRSEGSSQVTKEEPEYIRLWEKTKRHKDGSWDPNAEVKYFEFKALHAKQIEEHGVDSLSVEEAYIEVLKERPGYIRGLGAGPRPPKKSREGDDELSTEFQNQFSEKITNLQKAAADREAELRAEIEDLKSFKAEHQAELEKIKEEALQRERDAQEREAKMKEEFNEREKKMQEQFKKMMEAQFKSMRSSQASFR